MDNILFNDQETNRRLKIREFEWTFERSHIIHL